MESSKERGYRIIDNLKKTLEEVFEEKEFILEFPPLEFADISTNILFKVSKRIKKSPQEVFKNYEAKLNQVLKQDFEKIEFSKPGYLNFFFSKEALFKNILELYDLKKLDFGKGKKVLLEFVSANPTGPLTFAHGRQACVGDSLARILRFCGFKVITQYYINDEGRQITLLGESLRARYRELRGLSFQIPEDGYKGEYLKEIAKNLEEGLEEKPIEFFSEIAVKEILKEIKKDLEIFRVNFDEWISQKRLRQEGKIERVLNLLKEKGLVYEKEGAFWIKSSEFGDSKDRVVVKSNKEYTYLAPDIAFHYEKFSRNPDLIINFWGPDHHGYIERLKAAIKGLGLDDNKLKIIICQHVSLLKDNKKISMSTRKGEFYSLRELIKDIEVDSARVFYLLRRISSPLDFDVELAKKRTKDNPVYYIQYAHARICSIFAKENMKDFKVNLEDLKVLKEKEELDLMRILVRFKEILRLCVTLFEPYYLLDFLMTLSNKFHLFYERKRVLDNDFQIRKARLFLCKVTKNILKLGLGLLGVKALEKM